jgi:hypothetical protein
MATSMPPRRSGGGSAPKLPSKKGKQPAASSATAEAADDNPKTAAAGTATAISLAKLLRRLSTAPNIESYAGLAAEITPEARTLLTAGPSSSSSSSGSGSGSAVSLSDLIGALARGLLLLEEWAVEQGPAALHGMAALADGLAAALKRASNAETSSKFGLVHTLMESGEAEQQANTLSLQKSCPASGCWQLWVRIRRQGLRPFAFSVTC